LSELGAAKPSVVAFLLIAGALTGLLVYYTVSHRRPPIPADGDHAGVSEPVRCLSCHGPGTKNARGRNHPLNDQCFNCHERA
jgi:hypothetical protein